MPANPLISLEEIKNIDRFHDPSSLSSANAIMHDLCWSDPKETPGIGPNHRGTSVAFGPDITKAFLEYNNLGKLICSSLLMPHLDSLLIYLLIP